MWPELDELLVQYKRFLDEVAEDYVEILRDEVTGTYHVVCNDPLQIEAWDDFRQLLKTTAPFGAKWARWKELQSRACGKPTEAH